MILFNFNRRFKGLSPERFKEIFIDNQRMQRHNEQLIKQMNDFFDRYNKLSEEDRKLLTEVKSYYENLPLKGLVFEKNVYWLEEKESKNREGPFCPICYDKNRQLIHLLPAFDQNYYKCGSCDIRLQKPHSSITDKSIID